MEDIVARGAELNRKWLFEHPKHHLYATWENVHQWNREFVETCCEITAEMLREHVTPHREWTYALRDPVDIALYSALDLSAVDLDACPFFQISLGSDVLDTDHIYSVIGGKVYESYFRQRPLQCLGQWDGVVPFNGHVILPG